MFLIIKIQFERNKLQITNEHLKKLEEIANNSGSLYYKQVFSVGKALVFKASSEPKQWTEAITILEKIVHEEILNHTLTADALIILSELLISEFSYTGDTGILHKLEQFTDELERIANKQNSFHTKLEATHIRLLTLWLKAQYSLAEIDLERAKFLLSNIRDMADREGLVRLAEKITQQHEEIVTRIDQWAIHVKNYYDFIKD